VADTAVAITAGTGTNIDTRTEATNGNHRQVVVIGDPATNAGVAPVDVTAGLKVDLGGDNDVTVTSGTITTVSTVTAVTNVATVASVTAIANALPAGTNAIGKLAANSGVDIGDVDVTSCALPTGASTSAKQDTMITSLQLLDDAVFAEDVAAQAADKGIAVLAVRRDADTSLVGTDNDYANLQVNSTGSLKVAITAGAGSGGTALADEASFTLASTSFTPIGGVYNSSPDTLTTGKGGAFQMTTARGLHAHMVDAAGATITPSSDYTHDGALTIGSTAGPVAVFRATSAADAAVSASDDAVVGCATLTGKQIVMPYATPAQTWNYAAAAGGLVTTSGVTAKTAGAAGVRHYITSAQIINSHQTIGTEVLIRDGASGTVLHRSWAQFTGGGGTYRFDPPLRGTAATLVEIAEVTATATAGVLVNLQGYSAAE